MCGYFNRHALKVPLHTAHLLSEVSLLLPQFAVKWCPPGGPCRDK